jgi:hypothetical protein
MEAGAIFESLLEKNLYKADGTVKPHFRDFLLKQGRTEEEIAQFESQKRREIADRKLYAPVGSEGSSLRDKIIARAGLDVEELLSQGYLAVEDLEFTDDVDSYNWEDLL